MKNYKTITALFYTTIIYIIVASCMLTSCNTPKATSSCSQVWMPSYSGERNPKTVAFIDSIHKQDSIMGRYPFNK